VEAEIGFAPRWALTIAADDARMAACSSFPANHRGMTMPLPKVGTKPPAFTLPNQDGKKVSLADYAGKNVLVWFYPRAFGNG
jgi:hypothetical protein